jgi:hypothetical protein
MSAAGDPWAECSNCSYCSRADGCCWCAAPLPDPCACTSADALAEARRITATTWQPWPREADTPEKVALLLRKARAHRLIPENPA